MEQVLEAATAMLKLDGLMLATVSSAYGKPVVAAVRRRGPHLRWSTGI